MSIKLNNTQLVLLGAAAQREDRLLSLPRRAKLHPGRGVARQASDDRHPPARVQKGLAFSRKQSIRVDVRRR